MAYPATPLFSASAPSACGPPARLRHAGSENRLPTGLASVSTTGLGKSARTGRYFSVWRAFASASTYSLGSISFVHHFGRSEYTQT